jgi:hypothetical protein
MWGEVELQPMTWKSRESSRNFPLLSSFTTKTSTHVYFIYSTTATSVLTDSQNPHPATMATVPIGVIISGRPVLTDAQVVSETQFAFQIPSQPSFAHIVVFLLPGITLPNGTAAAVYAQLPGATQFKLLGAVANEKPSAIFKVNDKAGGPASGGIDTEDVMADDGMNGNGVLALGISIEPVQQVATALEQQKGQAQAAAPTTSNEIVLRGQNTVTTKVLAQRIIKNCYDFLTSWGSGDTVPLKAFQAWWTKFENKIERDPGFLERSDGG